MADISLKVSCHCGLASYACSVPASAFPLRSALCSCRSCRRASGLLFASFAIIPVPKPNFSKLTEYASSASLSRYFCPRCGACVGNTWDEGFEFSTGMLEQTEGLLKRSHLWIADCKDGGAAQWLGHLGGEGKGEETETETRLQGAESEQMTAARIKDMVDTSRRNLRAEESSSLPATCHCGDVQFSISRPTDDKQHPGGRYEAMLDACTSCRTVSGFEITTWARIPRSEISMQDGLKPLDLSLAALGHYTSSPHTNRYFCKRCGALVFYHKDGDDHVDVGVGLLDAESGPRAESWLAWKKRDHSVEFAEDATDRAFVHALAEGIAADEGP